MVRTKLTILFLLLMIAVHCLTPQAQAAVAVLNQNSFTLNVTSWITIGSSLNYEGNWIGEDGGDFSDPNNWKGGFPYPPFPYPSFIIGSGIANILSPPPTIGELIVGTSPDGEGGTGTLSLSGNAVFNHTTLGWFSVGDAASGATTSGYLNLSGNSVLNNSFGRFIVGNGASGRGYLTITDNATLNLSGADFDNIGFLGGTGVVNMDSGTVNKTGGGYLLVGGNQGTGTWNHNGGTINSVSSPIVIGDDAGSTGIFRLNRGLLNTTGVQGGVAWDTGHPTGNFYFNGGTLQAAASGNLMTVANTAATLNAYISADGAKINTNGFNSTITTPLLEDSLSTGGGLTKLGSGTLTLSNLNTYTGDTIVSAGILNALDIVTPDAAITVEDGVGNELIAKSIVANSVTIGNGAKIIIKPRTGLPSSARGSLTPIPEPSTWAMLILAAMGLGIYWRRGR